VSEHCFFVRGHDKAAVFAIIRERYGTVADFVYAANPAVAGKPPVRSRIREQVNCICGHPSNFHGEEPEGRCQATGCHCQLFRRRGVD
jgi:hypothetical protein